MSQNNNILQELSGLNSSLANTVAQNIFEVPDGYFENLATLVLNRIHAINAASASEELDYLSPLLNKIPRQMPYAVPAGYFEDLEESMMQSVRESNDYTTAKEELESISPMLSGLNREMPYRVPRGYFEDLKLNTATHHQPQARVISFTGRAWIRYAAAAVITGLIVVSGFLYFSGGKETGGKALAKFTRDIKKMDDSQKDNLIEYIDAGLSGNESAKVITPNKPGDVKALLQGVSDKELKDFQEQTEDIEDVLMTN